MCGMAVINILDKHTAELIAAGEVVERPSSVVKELLENAIDANSKNISVSIKQGGIKYIEIQDDGTGIDPEEIPKAFIRHATSKIASEDDLHTIFTLGFRGEALASIASVAKVTLISKTENSEFAMQYNIEGGEEKNYDTAARPVGTTIIVEDLFYNTPARMKFLKKDQSEASYIQEIVLRIALSHPEISFQFVKEGKTQFHTPGNGDLLTAIHSLHGGGFASGLLPVSIEQDGNTLTGFVTKPAAARGSRSMQFFFINGRYIKNTTMMAGLEQAYKGTVMSGKFPGCILHLSIPPEKIDVNVHPAKTEVRFANESEIFSITYQSVKGALSAPEVEERYIALQGNIDNNAPHGFNVNNSTKTVNFTSFENDKQYSITSTNTLQNSEAETLDNLSDTLFSKSNVPYSNTIGRGISIEVEEKFNFYSNEETKNQQTLPTNSYFNTENSGTASSINQCITPNINKNTAFRKALSDEEFQVIGEIFKTYVVVQLLSQICFIDKHAAHERILYEKLLKGIKETQGQMLLVPVDVQLSSDEKEVLLSHFNTLTETGIHLEDFGGISVLVRTVPPNVTESEIPALISEIAQKLLHGSTGAISTKQEWIYASISCRGAIKAGDYSNEIEMIALAKDILKGSVPKFCPHGRPIVLTLTKKEIEKYFGRLG